MKTDEECPNCSEPLHRCGAESRGDGDMYDVIDCPSCGRIYEEHVEYCECVDCQSGVNKLHYVYDPEEFPFPFEDE